MGRKTAMLLPLGALCLATCLDLAGCGTVEQLSGDGPADMTETLPPQGRPDRHHRPPPGDQPEFADTAPPVQPPEQNGPGGRDPFGPQGGSVSLGQGGADITPHPATPDTEVKYGRN